MAKIDVINNQMAMFMVCEAVAEQRHDFDFRADENGLYDLSIQFNGKEVDVQRFLDHLQENYHNAVKKQAADLLSNEYSKMLDKIYTIQEALDQHEKIFDEKVYIP